MADRKTIDYYEANADHYGDVAPDAGGNFVAYRNTFIHQLPPRSRVLDLGCGGGHAALAFIEEGFDVVALDGSAKLAGIAGKRTGTDVVVKDFAELDYQAEFDGIWAAASLTHVPLVELADVFARVAAALRERGLLVASFKCSEADWRDGRGRFYVAMNAADLSRYAERAGFDIHQIDVVPGRGRDDETASWAWLFATRAS